MFLNYSKKKSQQNPFLKIIMTFFWQIGQQKSKITLLDSVQWQLISFFNCILINIFVLFMVMLCVAAGLYRIAAET